MLKAATGGRQTNDPASDDFWLEALLPLDATLATQGVLAGIRDWRWFPSWAEFREAYKAQEKLREPQGEQRATMPGKYEVPGWIKRWAAARYLYARFDREQDMRPFREQYPSSASPPPDVPQEWMPEEEWVKESKRVSDADVWGVVR